MFPAGIVTHRCRPIPPQCRKAIDIAPGRSGLWKYNLIGLNQTRNRQSYAHIDKNR